MHGQQNIKYSFWVNEVNFEMNLKGTGHEGKNTTLVVATVWNVNAWKHKSMQTAARMVHTGRDIGTNI
jgi:hypothetical protein